MLVPRYVYAVPYQYLATRRAACESLPSKPQEAGQHASKASGRCPSRPSHAAVEAPSAPGKMRQSLDPDERHRLQPQHTNLLIRIEWDSSGEEIADLDLGCVLLDAQGRSLETVDFNNPTSADGACGYGGDEVGADEGRSDEELFIDTRKINDKAHSVALVASQFAGSFGSSMLDDLEVFIVSLAFRDAASERPWQERAVLKSETLFRGRLVADHFEAE